MNTAVHPEHGAHAQAPHRVSDVLIDIAQSFETEDVTVGEIIDGLQDRAFGFVMLVLALPCCIPFLYGVPQVVSIPMLFVAGQITVGRHTVWLPQALRERTISRATFLDMARRAKRYLGWAENLSRARLTFLTHGPAERIFGLFMVIFSCSISLPLPSTNTVPGIAVAIMSVGFIERDGLMVIAGTILGAIWVSLLIVAAAMLFVYGIDFLGLTE